MHSDTGIVEILLVEDDPADVRLTSIALERAKVYNRLHTVSDGIEAMAFLRKEGNYAQVPRPDLILLDLNLPKKDGREVLQEVKSDSDLMSIPVVVLTTSDADQDILRAYELQANCYVTKPVQLNEFMKVVQSIDQFWLAIVKLPPHGLNQ